MHPLIEQLNSDLPYPATYPSTIQKHFDTRDYLSFRNLAHFKHVVSKLTQKSDNYCGMTYAEALGKLMRGDADFPRREQQEYRDIVRSNLHMRGLITEEVYEAYRYTVDGTTVAVDVGKFVTGEPDCVMSPAREYVDYFYELFVNISYPYHIENDTIRANCAKMLTAIEELERKHIFIKVTMILPIKAACNDGRNFFSDIPLFSHKEYKSVETMSSIVNDSLLRKFYFAVLEDQYAEKIAYGYGLAQEVKGAVNIGGNFDEVDFFEKIMNHVGFE